MHTSVFLTEAIDALKVTPGGLYIDATYGQGGHSKEIIRRGGTVLALDLDVKDTEHDPQNTFRLVRGNFQDIRSIAHGLNVTLVDGILFDFGLSMNQLSDGGIGLSYKKNDEPLDMRLSGEGMTAADFLNEYSKEQLTDLFMRYAEDNNADRYAQAMILQRKQKPYETVGDLLETMQKILPADQSEKTLARVFQALRIMVNKEYETIIDGLKGAIDLIKPGGTIVTITFHSIEDRWVKRFIREHKSVVTDQRIDVAKHRFVRTFERSATLRVMTKKI